MKYIASTAHMKECWICKVSVYIVNITSGVKMLINFEILGIKASVGPANK